MFYDDAVEGSRLLGITLTKRQNYPMAGIPYHVIDQYLPKILACNKKVAICDQNEPPVSGKLVKRSVTRIITPGTVMEDAQLDSRSGNYIFAVDIDRSRRLYAAWMEMSAGEFYCAEFDTPQDFLPVLSAFDAKEVLLPEDASREWAADPELAPWHAIFRSVLDTHGHPSARLPLRARVGRGAGSGRVVGGEPRRFRHRARLAAGGARGRDSLLRD